MTKPFMKRYCAAFALFFLVSGSVLANDPVKAAAPQEITPEQLVKVRELIKADMVNWVALDPKDFVAKNEAGERVTTVRALVHTKKALQDFKEKIKDRLDKPTAKLAYEIEASSVIILRCDVKLASLHTITPADGKMPAIGDAKMLNTLQIEALVEDFCK
jgi:hypothetical protein